MVLLRAGVVLLTLFAGLSLSSVVAADGMDPRAWIMSTTEKQVLEEELTQMVNDFVAKQPRLPGQRLPIRARVVLEPADRVVIVELGAGYIPSAWSPDFEEANHAVYLLVAESLQAEYPVTGVHFTYGGRALDHYFPELFQKPGPEASKKADATGTIGEVVTVSPGHGRYFRRDNQQWDWQRDEHNGVREDVNNPFFTERLIHWFFQRDEDVGAIVRTRSNSTAIHAPSGQEWRNVGAKYYIESILPNNPEVWDPPTRNPPTSYKYEYAKDTTSRPLLANHFRSAALFSVHSDAAPGDPPDPNIRGIRVYYAQGSVVGRQLAEKIICSLEEIVRAQDGYENFEIAPDARFGNHVENTAFNGPSVIIEAGFHTSPLDAIALLDPVYRDSTMKSMVKGYRLFKDNLPCEEFEITEIPAVTIPGGGQTVAPISVYYEGYPTFAVAITVEPVQCPPGVSCSGGVVAINTETPSPLTYGFRCNNATGSDFTMRFRTQVRDLDRLTTEFVEHDITCAYAPFASTSDAPGSSYIELVPLAP